MMAQSGTVLCPWPVCASARAFQNDGECVAHFQLHSDELLGAWNGPTKCSWPQCSAKATFKYRNNWKAHLNNIHIKPLLCPVSGCNYTKPFGKNCDLTRHISTIHEQNQKHNCPIASCEASTTSFARKDKLLKHIREEHHTVRCLLNHCGSIVLDGDQEAHLQSVHGSHECAVGACKHGLLSKFSSNKLENHLRTCHHIYWFQYFSMILKMRDSADNTAYDESKVPPKSQTDCQMCLKYVDAAN